MAIVAGMSSMNSKKIQRPFSLLCTESLDPKWTFREATDKEILKLKPLNMLFHNEFQMCVAGGFAAWVEGITTTYGDIDFFLNDGQNRKRVHDYGADYKDKRIISIINSGVNQFISMSYEGWLSCNKFDMRIKFAKWVLEGFDIKECKVAYFFCPEEMKYYYIRNNDEYTQETLLAINSRRMLKYIRRVRNPPSLKYLSLAAVKQNHIRKRLFVQVQNKYYYIVDYKNFINNMGINITS